MGLAHRVARRAPCVTVTDSRKDEWVSILEAARLLGCGHGPVERMVRQGVIERRCGTRGVPSLKLASVEAAAATWSREQRERSARVERRAHRRRNDPPYTGEVWLDSTTAALVLGLTANRVRQLAKAGRLPSTMTGTKLWFRRSDVERAAAARVFRQRLGPDPRAGVPD